MQRLSFGWGLGFVGASEVWSENTTALCGASSEDALRAVGALGTFGPRGGYALIPELPRDLHQAY